MYKAFKYKLELTNIQEIEIIKWMGCNRWIWNYCLTTNINEYQQTKKFIFKHDLKKQLPHLKKDNPWLSEIPSQALMNRIIDFETALKRVWQLGNGFPKYKNKHQESHNTLRIDQTNNHIKIFKKSIKIPKIGWIKWNRYRSLEGELKNITIKKENNFWYCICLCKIPDPIEIKEYNDEDVIGIDLGLIDFAITSDGEIFDTKKLYRKQQKKLKQFQRRLSRKKKGSNNRNKAKKKLNKLHYRIKNQRRDYTHKTSSSITKNYKFICVEDLNIKGMSKNRKLSKSILDQGLSMFVQQLEYKSRNNGGKTVKIDRFAPSTKTCHYCDHKQIVSLNERIYNCESCGLVMNRDLNAAINIKRWGLLELNRYGIYRINACGDNVDVGKTIDFSSHVSTKQEKLLVDDNTIIINQEATAI